MLLEESSRLGQPRMKTALAQPFESAIGGMRYVARQPILDAHGRVHGYELLFRSGPAAVGFSGDGNTATRTVLDSTMVFGMERLTSGRPMFVNCTAEALMSGLVKVLPTAHTVLELLETLEPTPALVEVCRELKAEGYRLALDDFENKPEWQPLLELADYVKVDISQTTPEQRAELKQRVAKLPVRLLMERVETPADFALAKSEGFTLFQGYYFCRPVLMENRDIPANRLVYLELMKAVLRSPLDVKHVSGLVKRDPSLTYRLLRMANSPLYATRKEITSIHSALVMVGDEMFSRMVVLATACELKGNHPSELLRMAFLRGRFCELASSVSGQDATEQYLLGILSLVPAMLSVPMESIAQALPLRKEVREALLGESNAERKVLDWLICHEHANWSCSDKVVKNTDLVAERLPSLYAEALVWAEKNMSFAGR